MVSKLHKNVKCTYFNANTKSGLNSHFLLLWTYKDKVVYFSSLEELTVSALPKIYKLEMNYTSSIFHGRLSRSTLILSILG